MPKDAASENDRLPARGGQKEVCLTMSDQNNEKELNDVSKQYELSETLLGGFRQEEPPAEPEQQNEETAVEPKPEAPEEPAAAAAEQGNGETQPPVDYSRTFRSLSEGDVVGGVVVHIDKEGVLVDVGTKSEGLIRPDELSRNTSLSPEDVVQVGDRIDVYVMQSETQEGNLMLSKKRADFEKAWERVEQAFEERKTLNAMVTDRVKGGLVVDLGIRGFVPASHVGGGNIRNLDKFLGQSLPLKVIEVDRERRKVVLSHRIASDEERDKRRAQLMEKLAEGQIVRGIVRRLTDYGAFIDLGGIDGLLHISEMSWTRIKHPSDVLKVNQKLQVIVLKLNLDQEKVSLGLRQILPDPWSDVDKRYHIGDVIRGSVTRLVPFGAFVQVEGGIEGIIPNSELARRRVNKPEDVVSVGQEVEVKVLDLRLEERRMTLSLRALETARERARDQKEMAEYSARSTEPRTTIADLVGHAFAGREEMPADETKQETAGESEVEVQRETSKKRGRAKRAEKAAPETEAEAEAKPKRKSRAKAKQKAEEEAAAEVVVEPEAAEEPAAETEVAPEITAKAEAPTEEVVAAEAEAAEPAVEETKAKE